MANGSIKNDIIALLTLMISKAEQKHLEPSIKTSTLLKILNGSGITLNYDQLEQLFQDEDLAGLIKSSDDKRITLQAAPLAGLADNRGEDEAPEDEGSAEDQEGAGEESTDMSADSGIPGADDMTGQDDMSAQPAQPTEPEIPEPPKVPAGKSGPSQVSTMAKRALSRS
jgi:ribosomal protein L12E/L44/L45/RPP1/RPP2